ncbi:MAG: hypothetical protein ACOYL3_29540, partial [Desulfuromonadaceae bacterium]
LMPVSVSVTADQNNVCAGTTVNFTATGVNGGAAQYQWYRNNLAVGLNQPVYSCVPVNGDQVHVVMTSGLTCTSGNPASSDTIMMTISPALQASVAVTVSQNNICTGTPVTFTAVPFNGGNPVYQWYRNSFPVGSGSPDYTCTPDDGDQVYVVMTSSLSCVSGSPATSGIIIMSVTLPVPVSVSITESQNNVCAGTPVTFTAIPINGGNALYQWYQNGNAAGSGLPTYTCTPADGDRIWVAMTSGLTCTTGNPAISDTVVMVVFPQQQVSVTISTPQSHVCEGTPVTITASPLNGGNASYQWYVNGYAAGTGQQTLTYIPANGDVVHTVMTSGMACTFGSPAVSDTIVMTVDELLPVSVVISADKNDICEGVQVTFTAVPVNAGNAVYNWFRNEVQQGINLPVYSCVPQNGDRLYATVTSDLMCTLNNPASSDTVTLTVYPVVHAAVSITADKENTCPGIPVIFTASTINGGNADYQWYRNGYPEGVGTAAFTVTPAHGDQVHLVMTSGLMCVTGSPATSNLLTVSLKPMPGPAGMITGLSS